MHVFAYSFIFIDFIISKPGRYLKVIDDDVRIEKRSKQLQWVAIREEKQTTSMGGNVLLHLQQKLSVKPVKYEHV